MNWRTYFFLAGILFVMVSAYSLSVEISRQLAIGHLEITSLRLSEDENGQVFLTLYIKNNLEDSVTIKRIEIYQGNDLIWGIISDESEPEIIGPNSIKSFSSVIVLPESGLRDGNWEVKIHYNVWNEDYLDTATLYFKSEDQGGAIAAVDVTPVSAQPKILSKSIFPALGILCEDCDKIEVFGAYKNETCEERDRIGKYSLYGFAMRAINNPVYVEDGKRFFVFDVEDLINNYDKICAKIYNGENFVYVTIERSSWAGNISWKSSLEEVASEEIPLEKILILERIEVKLRRLKSLVRNIMNLWSGINQEKYLCYSLVLDDLDDLINNIKDIKRVENPQELSKGVSEFKAKYLKFKEDVMRCIVK